MTGATWARDCSEYGEPGLKGTVYERQRGGSDGAVQVRQWLRARAAVQGANRARLLEAQGERGRLLEF